MLRKSIFLTVLVAVGFALTAALLHVALAGSVDPLRLYAEERSEKLESVVTDPRRYPIAAFGSSRVHTAFDPRSFDKELRTKGEATLHSYNLAIVGGSQTEQRMMALRYVDYLKKSQIKGALIVLELSAGLNLQNEHLVHPRAINLYDLNTVKFSMSFTSADAGFARTAGRSGYALAAGSLHQLNVGMLASVIFEPDLSGNVLLTQYGDDKRGFLGKNTTHFAKQIESLFAARAADRRAIPALAHPGYAHLINNLADAAGDDVQLHFVYVVMPTLSKNLQTFEDNPEVIHTSSGAVPVLDYARNDLLLGESGFWTDPGHLSETGARIYSADLARRLFELNILPINQNAVR